MRTSSLQTAFAALLLGACASVCAADAPAKKSEKAAPVAQPETDRTLSNSGEVVPGQPIRPESQEEASVPKTPKDKEAATSADVGAEKTNTKAQRSMSGSDTGNTPKTPKTPKP